MRLPGAWLSDVASPSAGSLGAGAAPGRPASILSVLTQRGLCRFCPSLSGHHPAHLMSRLGHRVGLSVRTPGLAPSLGVCVCVWGCGWGPWSGAGQSAPKAGASAPPVEEPGLLSWASSPRQVPVGSGHSCPTEFTASLIWVTCWSSEIMFNLNRKLFFLCKSIRSTLFPRRSPSGKRGRRSGGRGRAWARALMEAPWPPFPTAPRSPRTPPLLPTNAAHAFAFPSAAKAACSPASKRGEAGRLGRLEGRKLRIPDENIDLGWVTVNRHP